MTLFKQIIIILTFFQTLILSVVMWQNFNTANEFIKTQLYTDAKHTANSLGLSITSVANINDISTIETMINSVFDSGYYESIYLNDPDGKELIKNYQPTVIADVPKWFVGMIELEAPVAKSEIMAGWTPFGTLHVQNNSGLAYRQLWLSFKEISLSFIIISIIAFIILNLILKLLLKPLDKVREQAEAILENDFIFQKEIPITKELKNVVFAMNSMIKKVKEIFDKEADTVKKYHELLYQDTVTKLYNRRYFQVKLTEYLLSEEESQGSVIFISFYGQENLKSTLGYERAESFLKKVAKIMDGFVNEHENSIVSRMNEGDFAILLPTSNVEATDALCMSLAKTLQEVIGEYDLDEKSYFFNFGITKYAGGFSTKEVFSKADFALTTSKSKGAFEIARYIEQSDEKDVILGKEAWLQELQVAIDQKRFKFAIQKSVQQNGETYAQELFLRLEDYNGHMHNAGYFMPMVSELGLNSKIDLHVITRVTDMLNDGEFLDESLCINIGKEVLLDTASWTTLENNLKTLSTVAKKPVYFEVPSRGQISVNILAKFSKLLRSYGFGLGLDNFTIDGDILKDLKEINPSYLKVQQSYLLDLFGEGGSESAKKSLEVITNSMDILLIAIGVEQKEQRIKLEDMGIKCIQGSLIEKPYIRG